MKGRGSRKFGFFVFTVKADLLSCEHACEHQPNTASKRQLATHLVHRFWRSAWKVWSQEVSYILLFVGTKRGSFCAGRPGSRPTSIQVSANLPTNVMTLHRVFLNCMWLQGKRGYMLWASTAQASQKLPHCLACYIESAVILLLADPASYPKREPPPTPPPPQTAFLHTYAYHPATVYWL